MIDISAEIPESLHELVSQGIFLSVVSYDKVEEMLLHKEMSDSLSDKEWLLAKRYRQLPRKLSWLAGQFAGKLAYQKMNPECALCDVEILRNEYGAPFISQDLEVHISISHSDGIAFAGVSASKFGIDLEKNESRSDSFVNTWLSSTELADLSLLSDLYKDSFVNQCWTLKEAYSKLLGVGGRLPFKKFCSIEQPEMLGLEKQSVEFQNYIFSLIWEKQSCVING